MTEKSIHPSRKIHNSYSDILNGKRIIFGITGSVAAYKSPEIARELIRHGAEIIPVITKDGEKMIGENLIWWATGVEPITEISGKLEHISLAGVMNEPADMMLIIPSTTNTIAKLANGITDNGVSLIANSIMGKGIPLMVLCVAHIDLINSPANKKNLERLSDWGVKIIEPVVDEGKAKVPKIDDIIFDIMTGMSNKDLIDMNIIVTGGPTREYIDKIRYITNGSSGRMGIEIARIAMINGANTKLLLGHSKLETPRSMRAKRVSTTGDMIKEMMKLLKDNPKSVVILSSAMADFTPQKPFEGKIKSGETVEIKLLPTDKLSNLIKREFPDTKLVLFKAEWDVSKEVLIERAMLKMKNCNADLMIANDISRPEGGFDAISNHVLMIKKDKSIEEINDTKLEIARKILDEVKYL